MMYGKMVLAVFPKKSEEVKDSFAKISNKIPAEKWDREATDRMFAKQLQEIVFCILMV